VNLVDSSAWLEYFADGSNAAYFAPIIEATEELLVPTVVLLDVFKRVLQQRGESPALEAAALLQQGELVPLDPPLALEAARLGVETKLPLADSIVRATARAFGATLWTQDADFQALPGVRYRPKRSSR
jgi:toxin FitB